MTHRLPHFPSKQALQKLMLPVNIGALALGSLLLMGCPFSAEETPIEGPDGKSNESLDELLNDDILQDSTTSVLDDRHAINPHFTPLVITTSDGFELHGTLYSSQLPEYKPEPIATPGQKETKKIPAKPDGSTVKKTPQPLIILLHPLSSNRSAWNAVINPLTEKGFAVLAFDMRGHGRSVYKGGQLIGWREFDKVDWQRAQRDLSAVLTTLTERKDLSFVKQKRVSLMGADIGANLALLFAQSHPTQVNAIVALSPGLDTQGLEPEKTIDLLVTPTYYVASGDDTYSAQSTKTLFEGTGQHKKLSLQKGQAHGVDMLNNDAALMNHLIAWLNQYATGAKSTDPALADDTKTAKTDTAKKAKAEAASADPKSTSKTDTKKVESKTKEKDDETDAKKQAELKKAAEAKKAADAKKAAEAKKKAETAKTEATKPPAAKPAPVAPKPVRIEPIEAPPAPAAPSAPAPTPPAQ